MRTDGTLFDVPSRQFSPIEKKDVLWVAVQDDHGRTGQEQG